MGNRNPSDQAGTPRDQSLTIMHELGHALGLEHRGRDDVNDAPNYLSVMNYLFQAGIRLVGLAFSSTTRPPPSRP